MPKPSFTVPENYYRVSVKALILDEEERLLVCFVESLWEKPGWEMPGGGWDHAEQTIEECITRELREEIGAKVATVGGDVIIYKSQTFNGHPKVNLAVRVTLAAPDFAPAGDGITETRYVTREEFLQLPFQPGEAEVQAIADQIWPNS